MEAKLNIDQFCGENRVSRDDGARLREWIENNWKDNEKIIINFNDIFIASISFLDEAIAKLAFEHSKNELKQKLKLEQVNPFDRKLLNDLMNKRLEEVSGLSGK